MKEPDGYAILRYPIRAIDGEVGKVDEFSES
jgi:hypothetical protein